MERTFNTAGPCFPDEHYMLPPERRLGRVLRYVEQGKYFTLLGGRQTGKTTSLQWLVAHLNAGDAHRAIAVDLQTAREQPEPALAFRTILNLLGMAITQALPALGPIPDPEDLLADPATCLLRALQALSARSPLPLVVLFDEADCLVGAAMVSFLTQLRDGYNARRATPFPRAVALVGQREVRDYVLSAEERRAVSWLGSSSPFNITAAPVHLAPFTEPEVAELCGQHTEATGQRFEAEAAARIFHLSQGHPWLVNALAEHIVEEDVPDRAHPVTATHVEVAKEAIILERRTHIDSLIHRLRDPRVRRILDPMLAGGELEGDILDDDLAHVIGLGLVRVRAGRAEIANPIYREIIPRALTYVKQVSIDTEGAWYLLPDGSLDLPKLMAAFQAFWRKDGHLSAEGFSYRESGPHLMLMAFLQRVVNGGGRIEREYALGKGALDLLIEWRGARHAIEVKLRRDTETEAEALEQVGRYLDSLGLTEGWLVLFDLRSSLPWDQRLTTRTLELGEKKVHVVGC
jgi:hypothetical protein